MNVLSLSEAQNLIRARLRSGSRFVSAFLDDTREGRIVRYVLANERHLEPYAAMLEEPLPTLTDITPAAAWYERELRDIDGISVCGELDGRSLDPTVSEPVRRSASSEVSTVLYGPVRSGISESARWLIETAGEDFLGVQATMFYKRRRIEARFIGVALDLAPFIAEHVSGATAASHASAFSRACEVALEITIPNRARAARGVLVEFERIHQHLDVLAKLADDASLAVGAAQTFALKERVHRFLAAATGNRFARGCVAIGGVRDDLIPALRREAARSLDDLERDILAVVATLFETPSLTDRLIGTGHLSAETVVRFGGVGPVARGSGVSCDARTRDGWLSTPLEGDEALERAGDAFARASVRRREIRRAFRLIRNALDGASEGPHRVETPLRSGMGYARVESPQGELVYFVRIDDGLQRVAIRSATFANWPLFALSLPGNIFTDFSFVEHSFGAIQAESDR
ncbi:hydrogenase 3 large subunit [Vulcanimicrobium alpinum]|uniref:Hydrogenase 3 large subunit n=1 Tax=Vulcanimicrobium alpinum TaxID=3016050 RepID=A0AAN1Y101_UNVUL|nr:NADH-quinone oxidoreductase subunit C [Vulcanimicrobium alpinum]BDE08242.1 hydrogenase 3 large subunit [Vulcanimicrobium alpinum]